MGTGSKLTIFPIDQIAIAADAIELALGRSSLMPLVALAPIDPGGRGDGGVVSFELDASAHN